MSLLISKGKRNPIPNNLGPNFNPFLFNNRFFSQHFFISVCFGYLPPMFFHKDFWDPILWTKISDSYAHHLPTTLPTHPFISLGLNPTPPCHVVHASAAQNPPKNPRSGPRGRPRLTHRRPMVPWSDITQLGRGSHNPILKGLTIQ